MIWSLFEYSSLYCCLLSWLQFSNRGLSWQRLQTATPGRFLVKLSFFSSFRHLILSDLFLILPPRLVSYVFCLLSFVFCLCSLFFALCSLLFALWSFIFYLLSFLSPFSACPEFISGGQGLFPLQKPQTIIPEFSPVFVLKVWCYLGQHFGVAQGDRQPLA